MAYADEDAGYNLGVYALRPGPRLLRTVSALIAPGTPEAINLAHLIANGETDAEYRRGFGDPDWSEALDYTPLDDRNDPFDLIKEGRWPPVSAAAVGTSAAPHAARTPAPGTRTQPSAPHAATTADRTPRSTPGPCRKPRLTHGSPAGVRHERLPLPDL